MSSSLQLLRLCKAEGVKGISVGPVIASWFTAILKIPQYRDDPQRVSLVDFTKHPHYCALPPLLADSVRNEEAPEVAETAGGTTNGLGAVGEAESEANSNGQARRRKRDDTAGPEAQTDTNAPVKKQKVTPYRAPNPCIRCTRLNKPCMIPGAYYSCIACSVAKGKCPLSFGRRKNQEPPVTVKESVASNASPGPRASEGPYPNTSTDSVALPEAFSEAQTTVDNARQNEKISQPKSTANSKVESSTRQGNDNSAYPKEKILFKIVNGRPQPITNREDDPPPQVTFLLQSTAQDKPDFPFPIYSPTTGRLSAHVHQVPAPAPAPAPVPPLAKPKPRPLQKRPPVDDSGATSVSTSEKASVKELPGAKPKIPLAAKVPPLAKVTTAKVAPAAKVPLAPSVPLAANVPPVTEIPLSTSPQSQSQRAGASNKPPPALHKDDSFSAMFAMARASCPSYIDLPHGQLDWDLAEVIAQQTRQQGVLNTVQARSDVLMDAAQSQHLLSSRLRDQAESVGALQISTYALDGQIQALREENKNLRVQLQETKEIVMDMKKSLDDVHRFMQMFNALPVNGFPNNPFLGNHFPNNSSLNNQTFAGAPVNSSNSHSPFLTLDQTSNTDLAAVGSMGAHSQSVVPPTEQFAPLSSSNSSNSSVSSDPHLKTLHTHFPSRNIRPTPSMSANSTRSYTPSQTDRSQSTPGNTLSSGLLGEDKFIPAQFPPQSSFSSLATTQDPGVEIALSGDGNGNGTGNGTGFLQQGQGSGRGLSQAGASTCAKDIPLSNGTTDGQWRSPWPLHALQCHTLMMKQKHEIFTSIASRGSASEHCSLEHGVPNPIMFLSLSIEDTKYHHETSISMLNFTCYDLMNPGHEYTIFTGLEVRPFDDLSYPELTMSEKDYDGSDFEGEESIANHNNLIESLHGFKGSFVGNVLISKSTLEGQLLDVTPEEQFFLERMLVRWLKSKIVKVSQTSSLIALDKVYVRLQISTSPQKLVGNLRHEIERRVAVFLRPYGDIATFSSILSEGYAIVAGRAMYDFFNMDSYELEEAGSLQYPLSILAPMGHDDIIADGFQGLLGMTEDMLTDENGEYLQLGVEYTEGTVLRRRFSTPSQRKRSLQDLAICPSYRVDPCPFIHAPIFILPGMERFGAHD
ncbi:hypothetical protein BKA70DRAFT_1230537 [Coprinopsis sp. MPI-PUGE-AT-0042]|nr:hypothetical protein BKA70DRAFT_1230537 [Coprinopsis sp. MPI-PUGE-AT-0042]